jgi:hypothetical protein
VATLQYGDHEVAVAEDWRLGELIEAENALGVDMEKAKGGAKMAIIFFISIRRTDKQTPAHVLADQVMKMELTAISADEEESDPLGDAGDDGNDRNSETDDRRTTGRQLSVRSE